MYIDLQDAMMERTVNEQFTEQIPMCFNSPIEALLATGKIRYGKRPCNEHINHLCSVFEECAKKSSPIQITTLWGAVKGYGIFEQSEPDLSELSALMQFDWLNKAIKLHYRAGIKVRIVIEDVCEHLLTHDPSKVEMKLKLYSERIHKLVEFLDLDFITIVDESVLITEKEDLLKYHKRVDQNSAAMLRYIRSEDKNECELAELGWLNGIPPAQLNHCLGRVLSEYPDWDLAQCENSVSYYFGHALSRKQIKAIFNANCGPQIYVSFMAYPPGTPEVLKRGRIEYKSKPSSNSHKNMPPWSSFGLVSPKGWTQIGVSEYRNRPTKTLISEVSRLGQTIQLPVTMEL